MKCWCNDDSGIQYPRGENITTTLIIIIATIKKQGKKIQLTSNWNNHEMNILQGKSISQTI